MRLSVNLEEEVYAVVKSLAKAEDCSLSRAVNQLIRRGLDPRPADQGSAVREGAAGFRVSRGAVPITADRVAAIEADDDGHAPLS